MLQCEKDDDMPSVSFIGFPMPMLCTGHAGLGFREASQRDTPEIIAHFKALAPTDRRMRFCATLDDSAVERHVSSLSSGRRIVIAAHDGPLWASAFRPAGPIRALAELAVAKDEAELGISVDSGLRRRGIGTYLIQTAACLLQPRGVRRIRAYTLPENRSFIELARGCGAEIETGQDEVEVLFDVKAMTRAYHRRRVVEVFRAA